MKIPFVLLLALYCMATKEVLRQVHVLYRHGDRVPTYLCSNNLQKKVLWPFNLGQLTDVGIRQQFELGKWLRVRYDKLLKGHYDCDDIHVRSTDMDRTLMSAQSNLAGLYANEPSNIIPGIEWRPIPVHVVPLVSNSLVLPLRCNKFNDTVREWWNTRQYRNLLEKYQSTLNVIRKVFNRSNLKFEETLRIFDYLFCEKVHNITWDEWVTEDIYRNMSKIYDIHWRSMYLDTELGRLSGGRLLDQIVNTMTHFARNYGIKTKQFQMISGHDQDVSALLSALGLYDGIRPPYSACVMVELRYDPTNNLDNINNWVVKVFYKTNETESPIHIPEKRLQGCPSDPCRLGDFIDYVRLRLVDEESYDNCAY